MSSLLSVSISDGKAGVLEQGCKVVIAQMSGNFNGNLRPETITFQIHPKHGTINAILDIN